MRNAIYEYQGDLSDRPAGYYPLFDGLPDWLLPRQVFGELSSLRHLYVSCLLLSAATTISILMVSHLCLDRTLNYNRHGGELEELSS